MFDWAAKTVLVMLFSHWLQISVPFCGEERAHEASVPSEWPRCEFGSRAGVCASTVGLCCGCCDEANGCPFLTSRMPASGAFAFATCQHRGCWDMGGPFIQSNAAGNRAWDKQSGHWVRADLQQARTRNSCNCICACIHAC